MHRISNMDKRGLYYKSLERLSKENDHRSEDHLAISSTIHFWIILIPAVLAIVCSVIVLWIILRNAQHRRSLHYRIIIIQLILGLIFLLTHIPLYLNYLMIGYVWPQTSTMCHFWWFFGEGYSDTMTILMVWASFERHILIFHDRWLTTRKRRMFAHYIPVTSIIIYYLLFYILVNVIPFCENHYEYNEDSCGLSCVYKNPGFTMYEVILNDIVATILVAVFSISFIFRITCQNRVQLQTRNRWRKHRKVIIILLAISFTYLFFNLPLMLLMLAHLCGLSEEAFELIEPYVEFLGFYVFILYPFICFTTLLENFLIRRRRRLVGPMSLTLKEQSLANQGYRHQTKIAFNSGLNKQTIVHPSQKNHMENP